MGSAFIAAEGAEAVRTLSSDDNRTTSYIVLVLADNIVLWVAALTGYSEVASQVYL